MTLDERRQAMLNRRMNQTHGVAITYRRGVQSISIAEGEGAWPGRVDFTSTQAGGARLQLGERDYLIKAAAVAVFGEPKEGDVIGETINGVPQEFTLRTPASGKKAVEASGTDGTLYRVHTKRSK